MHTIRKRAGATCKKEARNMCITQHTRVCRHVIPVDTGVMQHATKDN